MAADFHAGFNAGHGIANIRNKAGGFQVGSMAKNYPFLLPEPRTERKLKSSGDGRFPAP
jgi:hypothetical protein